MVWMVSMIMMMNVVAIGCDGSIVVMTIILVG